MFLLILLLSTSLLTQQTDDSSPQALWQEATLKVDGETVTVSRTRDVWPLEKQIDNHLIRIEGNELEVIEFTSLNSKWKETGTVAHTWSYLGSESNVLYLVELNNDSYCLNGLKVQRRNLATGEKLDDLPIPIDDKEKGSAHQVAGALVTGGNFFLLTLEVTNSERGDLVARSYRLTKYTGGGQAWTESFPSAGSVQLPGAMILGTLGPGLDGVSSQSIVAMDSQLLISAGQKEDLMAIDVATGKVKWRIPRLWEYRRGFIGPSVWRYLLGRYGIEDDRVALAELTVEQLKEKNKKEKGSFFYSVDSFIKLKKQVEAKRKEIEGEVGWIFAGPVVMPVADGQSRIFVVTAQAKDGAWSNYLADAVVYEISEAGGVISMNTLPRLVQRNDFFVLEDRVAWRADEAIFELLPSRDGRAETFTRFNCQQLERSEVDRNAWLSQGAYTSSQCFSGPYLYSIEEGGWIQQRDSKEFHYPIRRTNLKAGQHVELEMVLPFQGKVKPPSNNYSQSGGRWTAYGSYLFMIDGISSDGQLLCITMRHGKTKKLLEFKLQKSRGLQFVPIE